MELAPGAVLLGEVTADPGRLMLTAARCPSGVGVT
jgi:hypothetical protein